MQYFQKLKVRTSNNVLDLVEKDGMMLEYVEYQSSEIVWAAVKQNINAYQFVKNPDPKLIMYAIDKMQITLQHNPHYMAKRLDVSNNKKKAFRRSFSFKYSSLCDAVLRELVQYTTSFNRVFH